MALTQIIDRRLAVMLLFGFSSGLPLALTGSTLQAWMSDGGVDLSVIGAFSLVGLPYALKPLWSPLLDRFALPVLGRRRGWILAAQLALAGAVLVMSGLHPGQSLTLIAAASVVIAIFSATQDIVVDAYRTEILDEAQFGLGASIHILGYRLAMLTSGALALFLADRMPWAAVYQLMAAAMVVGVVGTLVAPATDDELAPKSIADAVVQPLRQFLSRPGALEILLFVVIYKLGDTIAAAMVTPFLLDIGFTKTTIGAVYKVAGLLATIAGGLVGGVIMVRITIIQSLLLFGVLQLVSNFSFAVLAVIGANTPALAVTVVIENLAGGMGTAAYVAFLMALCDQRYTATQYALLTALMAVTRTVAGAPTGVMAESLGWFGFYAWSAVFALPGLLLLARAGRWLESSPDSSRP